MAVPERPRPRVIQWALVAIFAGIALGVSVFHFRETIAGAAFNHSTQRWCRLPLRGNSRRRFLVITEMEDAASAPATVVINWRAEVKK